MSETLPRGHIGVLPRPTRLADESYLDFVQSFRKILIQDMFPIVKAASEPRYAEWKKKNDKTDEDLDDIKAVFREAPVTLTWQRFVRSQQEMMWRRTRESFAQVADAHLDDLEKAGETGPSSLEADPDFKTPAWARQEIHLQPGGYTDDPLSGIVFHYGTRVFYEGFNDQDEMYDELAEKITLPDDGNVSRILDVGCAIGQGVLALKRRHPDADVVGLDVALPLLRYAQKRANDADADVAFRHGLAEDTKFPDNHFDAVMSYILFHEAPVENFPAIVSEIFRVLRPGGTLSIFEFPNNYGENLDPGYRFLVDYDSKNNCEPYSIDFVYCNFKGMLKEAGFEVEEGRKTMNSFLQSIVARKPA